MFEELIFLGAAVLFLITVIFYIYVYLERIRLRKKADRVQQVEKDIKVRAVELDIQEHELQVWQKNLEFEHKQLEVEREELRMLTATKQITLTEGTRLSGVAAPSAMIPSVGPSSSNNKIPSTTNSNKDDTKIG